MDTSAIFRTEQRSAVTATTPVPGADAPPLIVAGRQLTQLNRRYLALLASEGGLPDTVTLRLRAISSNPLQAIADCPFSLFTFGFEDRRRWLLLLDSAADDDWPLTQPHAVSACSEFAATVLFLAWHLARRDALAAKILLGLDAEVAAALLEIPVTYLHAVAQRATDWLQPRWPQNPYFWPALLRHSVDPEGRLAATKLLGRQLLAAELLAMPSSAFSMGRTAANATAATPLVTAAVR